MVAPQLFRLLAKHSKNTAGTGMRDDVPSLINNEQPAALSEGEYVIPADIVSMLGDGNSDAGAKILDKLVEDIRKRKGKHLAKGKQAPAMADLIRSTVRSAKPKG